MAQAFMPQQQKGTLIPGQTIAVNKYTVQVERYLSQGGFAHVYLVRTAVPVYNTTHHVLKRIAVPNEAMLTEVKKEVDIMRILKGHPNIVYLIDAAWHLLPNGTYEVFILMEFCAGGGIIDMMNRRLRERLTEPEILTIFCDVCEGLAAMHALKPPLLHRDLKVENILQASPTSYKLCDFGSATAVQKVPANAQEMRALEADLNRHTTLQYRAPEMVDVYLRRPVDEKSDVWALGVLLYKLCYYTTPFEEHGPLAILNVQYKIPPYPVYSNHMNALIASMLREHGAHRPTVFEILEHVHRLRGTKSRFSYAIPPKEPPLSPRALTFASPPLQALSPNIISPSTQQPVNPLDDLVSFKSQQSSPNKGIEARDKVLEAIAPMRRGRPMAAALPMPSPPASPKKDRAFDLDMKFGAEEDRAWRGVRGHKSGLASLGRGTDQDGNKYQNGDAWSLGPRGEHKERGRETDGKAFEKAFGDDFSSGFGKSFGDTFQPVRSPGPSQPASSQPALSQPAPSPRPQPQPSPQPPMRAPLQPTPSPQPTSNAAPARLNRNQSVRKARDAFDGLGLAAAAPPPTLGEARKNRTGLASLGMSSAQYLNAPSAQTSGLGTTNTTYRPPSAHSPLPTPSPQPIPQPSASAAPQPIQARRSHFKAPSYAAQRPAQGQNDAMSAEQRFPSLEELDREFGSPSPVTSPGSGVSAPTGSERSGMPSTEKLFSGSRPPSRASYMRGSGVDGLPGSATAAQSGVSVAAAGRNRYEGIRSQNSTGTAMREPRLGGMSRQPSLLVRPSNIEARREIEREMEKEVERERAKERERERKEQTQQKEDEKEKDVVAVLRSRPSAARRHKHSGSKTPSRGNSTNLLSPSSSELSPPALPPRPQPSPRPEPRDWLTGMDEDDMPMPPPSPRTSKPEPQPVMRESPSKRASYIERSPITFPKPLEAESVLGTYEEPQKSPRRESKWEWEDTGEKREKQREERRQRRSPERARASANRTGTSNGAMITGGMGTRGLRLPPVDTGAASRQEMKPSPSGLTDNWSPIAATSEPAAKSSSSSSSEDGPEDVKGFAPGREERRFRDRVKGGTGGGEAEDKRRMARSKGRQSSVHNLVDLWDGGPEKETREKEKGGVVSAARQVEKRKSVIMPSPSVRPPPLASKPRAESPQPLIDTSASPLPNRIHLSQTQPPSSPHRRQPSATPAIRHAPAPSPVPVSAPMAGRSRPQSMFITSLSKSSSTETNASSSSAVTSSTSTTTGQPTLSPPADPNSRRTTRRSSISDMVQRFEAIGGAARPVPSASAPGAAHKPVGLNVKVKPLALSTSTSSGPDVPSPSAAAQRFPKLSPTNSPVMGRANLAVPDDAGQGRAERERERRSGSPAGGGAGLPSRRSPVERAEDARAVNGLPGRRSPLSFARPPSTSVQVQRQESPAPTFPARKTTLPAPTPGPAAEEVASPPVRSPSPEKPYQGVSKLIDRWNRAVDETGAAVPAGGVKRGGPPARRAGVVGAEAGRGR